MRNFFAQLFQTLPHLEFKKKYIYTNFKSKNNMEVLILRYF